MTDQDRSTAAQKRRPLLLPVIVIVIAAIGLGIGVVVAARNSDTTDTTSSSQISNVEQACQQWMGSATGTTVPSGWCRNMTDWMRQQTTDGQSGGSMMWGNPGRMAATCRQWASTADAPANSANWCDDMVAWMQGHDMGDDDWMGNGPMMGR